MALLLVLVAAAFLLAFVLGVMGRRSRAVQAALPWVAPVYATALFVYALFRGGPDECVPYPGPPGYACHATSFLSSVGGYGVLVAVVLTLVSFTPLVMARTGRRMPAILGTIVLAALVALYFFVFATWAPAAAAVLAAAIAGPPRPRQAKPAT